MASAAARLANAFPKLILRSPLHRLMSRRYAVIEFTGRRSGRQYATPIAYVRDGDRVLMSTDSPWWRNLKGGATVRLWLRGRPVEGTATPLLDPDASAEVIRQLIDAIPSYARMARVPHDGEHVSDSAIAGEVDNGRVGIEVTLVEAAS